LPDEPNGFLLKILAADGASVRRHHLGPGEHVVGSIAEAEIRIEEAGISRRHARIGVLADGGAVIHDLGSKNGTFVAGRRIREAAVCGFTMVAFGSVQALLQPADPARTDVLFGPGGPAGGSPAGPAGEGDTTRGLHPLERLAETLEEILPSLAEGLTTAEEAAGELACRWLSVLPLGRVEFLRDGPAGEAVVTAASTADAVPRSVAAFEVEGPDGWKIRLRAPSSARLEPLQPGDRVVCRSSAYSLLLIKTCHRRGAFAMGGMAAQIPIKNDPAANEAALAKVRADKDREATDGHDGTWVAHPGLVGLAKEAFDKVMKTPNQIHRQRDDVKIAAADLTDFRPQTPITENGVRININIGIQYLGAWLAGTGCVPIYNLMEDAATAEISRAQIWHWIRSSLGKLDDGRKLTRELFLELVPQELAKVREMLGEQQYAAGKYEEAAKMFEQLTLDDDFADFLTIPAYEYLIAHEHR